MRCRLYVVFSSLSLMIKVHIVTFYVNFHLIRKSGTLSSRDLRRNWLPDGLFPFLCSLNWQVKSKQWLWYENRLKNINKHLTFWANIRSSSHLRNMNLNHIKQLGVVWRHHWFNMGVGVPWIYLYTFVKILC